MQKFIDGGPAFPIPSMRQRGEVNVQNDMCFDEEGNAGMSLRDYFAAKAIQGIWASEANPETDRRCYEMAKLAYDTADEMLKARAKQ